jgi:hypothetical protein
MPWDERDGLVDLRPQHLTGKASGAGKSPGLDLSLLNAKLIAIRYASCAEREIVRYWTLSRDDFDIIFRERSDYSLLGFALLLCYLRYREECWVWMKCRRWRWFHSLRGSSVLALRRSPG